MQESDGVEVLSTTVAVRHPSPGRPRVVEVEHARHGVHPQPVDVELVEPVEGIGDEEVAHLVAPIVEDIGTPVGVLPLTGVGAVSYTHLTLPTSDLV